MFFHSIWWLEMESRWIICKLIYRWDKYRACLMNISHGIEKIIKAKLFRKSCVFLVINFFLLQATVVFSDLYHVDYIMRQKFIYFNCGKIFIALLFSKRDTDGIRKPMELSVHNFLVTCLITEHDTELAFFFSTDWEIEKNKLESLYKHCI